MATEKKETNVLLMNDNNVMICQDENGITKGTSD